VRAGGALPTEAELGDELARELNRLRTGLTRPTNLAYQMPGAGATGVGMAARRGAPDYLGYSPEAGVSLINRVQGILRGFTPPPGSPAEQALRELAGMISHDPEAMMQAFRTPLGRLVVSRNQAGGTMVNNAPLREFNQGHVNDALERIGNIDVPRDAPKMGRAMGQIREAVDDTLDDATRHGWAIGDPALLAQRRAATALAREKLDFTRPRAEQFPHANRFFSQQDPHNEGLTGQQLVDAFFGRGAPDSAAAAEIVEHIARRAPPGTPAHDVLKDMVIRRMILGRSGGRPLGPDSPLNAENPVTAANRIANAIGQGLPGGPAERLVRSVLTPEEFAQLGRAREMAQVMAQANRMNTSGSAYTAADMIRQLKPIPFLRKFLTELEHERFADRSMSGVATRQPIPTPYQPQGTARALAPTVGGLLGGSQEGIPALGAAATLGMGPLTADNWQAALNRVLPPPRRR
jgi:hypothetical protein